MCCISATFGNATTGSCAQYVPHLFRVLHQEVTTKLMQMTEQNSTLLVPVLQAISSMAVSEAGQVRPVDVSLLTLCAHTPACGYHNYEAS